MGNGEGEALDRWRSQYAPSILGNHADLHEVFRVLERVAPTDCALLITGESGTGKELIAKAVHAASPRRNKAFVAVNCAAIPENLLESEMFGHVRGAFTGAAMSKQGHFARANGGTLFLDELGELPLAMQAKLLRAIQEQEILPLGETRPQKVDVRIVAATNRNLEAMVEAETFREDLLYRLSVITAELPPLRERVSDIPTLMHHFIARCNKRWGRSVEGIEPSLLEALTQYSWPGNVRQLEHVVDHMVLLKSEGTLEWPDCPRKVRVHLRAQSTPTHIARVDAALPTEGIDLRDAVERFENTLILQALERTRGNKNQAAAMLRINRTTLVEKVKKKQLSI